MLISAAWIARLSHIGFSMQQTTGHGGQAMNNIDILLNSIAKKHLHVEVMEPGGEGKSTYNRHLYAALLCAFTNGVQQATSSNRMLIKEVDIEAL